MIKLFGLSSARFCTFEKSIAAAIVALPLVLSIESPTLYDLAFFLVVGFTAANTLFGRGWSKRNCRRRRRGSAEEIEQ